MSNKIALLKSKITIPNLLKLIGISTVGFARVLNNSVYIILTLIVVRLTDISTEEIGRLSYVLVLLTIFTMVSDLGMTEGVQKFIQKGKPAKTIGSSVIYKLLFATGLYGLILILDLFTNFLLLDNFLDYLLFGLAMVGSVYNVVILTFNALDQQIKSTVYQIVYVVVLLLVLLGAITFMGINAITGTLLAIAISWIFTSLLIIVDLARQHFITATFHPPKGFLSFSFSNMMFIVAVMVLTQSDSIFIVNLISGEEGKYINGIYKSVAMIGFFPKVFGLLLATPLLPIWSKMEENKQFKQAKQILFGSLGFLAAIFVPLVAITYFFGGWILDFIFAREDITREGAMLLPLIIINFSIHSINYVIIYYFEAMDRIKQVRILSIFQMIIYLIGMFSFTRMGLYAPALVLLVAEVAGLVYLAYNVARFDLKLESSTPKKKKR